MEYFTKCLFKDGVEIQCKRIRTLRLSLAQELRTTFGSMPNKVVVTAGQVGWLVVLRLNVPVNNFSVMSGRSHRFLGN